MPGELERKRSQLSQPVKFLVGSELPELSAAAFARVNAARERCDALFANGDSVTAAVQLLDAQAAEYLPLVVDDNFISQTLQILVATSLSIYGHTQRAERELETRCCHWRAQWWDLEALRKEPQPKGAPAKTIIAGRPSGVCKIDGNLAIKARGELSQKAFANSSRGVFSVATLQRIEREAPVSEKKAGKFIEFCKKRRNIDVQKKSPQKTSETSF